MVHGIDAAVAEDVLDLADGDHFFALTLQTVEDRIGEGLHGIVAAVLGAGVFPVAAHEGTRDDAADQILALQQVSCDGADAVQLLKGHDLLVRGDLEDTVGGGVDDELAGLNVLVSEALDDLGAACDAVAEGAAADPLLKLVHELFGEAVGEGLEGMLLHKTRHLPVTAGRILGVGGLGAAAECALRFFAGGDLAAFDVADAEFDHIGDLKRIILPDMAERIAARVAEFGRVGQSADAAAVDHDDSGSFFHTDSPLIRIVTDNGSIA